MCRTSLALMSLCLILGCKTPSGPTTYPEGESIDTTAIEHLQNAVVIPFEIFVYEYDSRDGVDGATVILDGKSLGTTDSAGFLADVLTVHQIPFKYCYEVTKAGYGPFGGCNWSTDTTILHLGAKIKPVERDANNALLSIANDCGHQLL